MANLFTAIIKDKKTGYCLWDHISAYSDDPVYVDGFTGKYSSLNGEYIKSYHLKEKIEREFPEFEYISKDFGEVDVEDFLY